MTRATNRSNVALASTLIWGRLLGAGDVRLRGGDHYVDAWPGDVQRIHGDGSARSARRTRLLIDNDADSARQGDRKVRVGDENGLARNGQSHQLRIPAGARLLATACGA